MPKHMVVVDDDYERIGVDLGAAQHITRPFHPLELVEKVKKVTLAHNMVKLRER